MPKIVDHEKRKRQITDAVCRITMRSGLGAATMRAVAAEAGVSVPLVQHYFATKAELLDITQQHVGERSTARLMDWIDRTDGSPREVLGAFLKSFLPADDDSRTAGLMYVALFVEAVVATDPDDPAPAVRTAETNAMTSVIRDQLEQGRLRKEVDIDIEVGLLPALTTGLGQYVLLGTISLDQAYATMDDHLDKLFLST